MSSVAPSFRVFVLGSAGAGKTTFLERSRTGEFRTKYTATVGTDVQLQKLYTSRGELAFVTHELAGQECYNNPFEQSGIEEADAVLIFFDVMSIASMKSAGIYYHAVIHLVRAGTPIALVANKVDCRDRKVTPAMIVSFCAKLMGFGGKRVPHYDFSAKTNYNFDKPFRYLARALLKDDALAFVEAPPLSPPSCVEASATFPLLDQGGQCFFPLAECNWRIAERGVIGVVTRDRIVVTVRIDDEEVTVSAVYLPTKYRGRVEDKVTTFEFRRYEASKDSEPELEVIDDRYRWTAPINFDELVRDVTTLVACIYA